MERSFPALGSPFAPINCLILEHLLCWKYFQTFCFPTLIFFKCKNQTRKKSKKFSGFKGNFFSQTEIQRFILL